MTERDILNEVTKQQSRRTNRLNFGVDQVDLQKAAEEERRRLNLQAQLMMFQTNGVEYLQALVRGQEAGQNSD